MNRTGNLRRLFAVIALSSRESRPRASFDGIQERVVEGWPGKAVGAMSTIETRPGM